MNPIKGTFQLEQCIGCHSVMTPGIVRDYKKSAHSRAEPSPTGCDTCHGNNPPEVEHAIIKGLRYQRVPRDAVQRAGPGWYRFTCFLFELCSDRMRLVNRKAARRYCWMHLLSHKLRKRCSTCHQRHQFDPKVARHAEQCKTCHWGKDHRDWEAYDIGLHGVVYQVNKWDPKQFDWTKKLADADYVGPTCQYCHMRGGHHNVQRFGTVYTSMGMSMADRGAPIWKEKRDRWASVCDVAIHQGLLVRTCRHLMNQLKMLV